MKDLLRREATVKASPYCCRRNVISGPAQHNSARCNNIGYSARFTALWDLCTVELFLIRCEITRVPLSERERTRRKRNSSTHAWLESSMSGVALLDGFPRPMKRRGLSSDGLYCWNNTRCVRQSKPVSTVERHDVVVAKATQSLSLLWC